MIEQLDDVLESIADEMGVYGSHSDGESVECRVCWMSRIRERIDRAVEIEAKLRS